MTAHHSTVLRPSSLRPAELSRFFLEHECGLREVRTKIENLQEEFLTMHDYNPIEHVSTRSKSPKPILDEVSRKGGEPSLASVRSLVSDIAGVRVTCSFGSDVYELQAMLTQQPDLTVLQVEDYIADPKPNGYRSVHLLVTVPVFLSTSVIDVPVEIQLRTVAMDFWATLEHKIHHKHQDGVPEDVLDSLEQAARTAHQLDTLMEGLHVRVRGRQRPRPGTHEPDEGQPAQASTMPS